MKLSVPKFKFFFLNLFCLQNCAVCDMCVHTCECRYAHTNNKNVFISLCGGEATTEGISPCLPPCLRIPASVRLHFPSPWRDPGVAGMSYCGLCLYSGVWTRGSCLGNSDLFTEPSPQPHGLFQLEDFLIMVSVSASLSVMDLFRFLKPSSWFDFYRLGKSPFVFSKLLGYNLKACPYDFLNCFGICCNISLYIRL